MKTNRKTLILIVVAVIVVGALLYYKKYPSMGLSVTLLAIGLYLLCYLRIYIRNILHFKRLSHTSKIQVITFTAQIYILIQASVTSNVPYFLLLTTLGIDYLICDRQHSK